MNWSLAIKNYSNYLKLERGLSIKSVDSYCSDISKLVAYLDEYNLNDDVISISYDTIKEFLITQVN